VTSDATPGAEEEGATTGREVCFEASSKIRLDAFLVAELAALKPSRVQVQGWIKASRVRVDGGVVRKPSYKLAAGAQVLVVIPRPPPPLGPLQPEDVPLPILYQDAHILVLNKPAGMTVHPGAGQRTGTLVNALLHHSAALSSVGGEERPGIVHRLDKETTGVIVVARTDAAHREVARQFHDREVRKRYLALTDGVPRAKKGIMEGAIGRHPKDRKRMAVVEGGRTAHTAYRVLESLGRYAFVECNPRTGRTHQIRVHLQSINTPILADKGYGRGRPERFTSQDLKVLGPLQVFLERHALHASRLELTHPVTAEAMIFEAPLPPDMRATLEALREAAKSG
jgi:23S rRNA pseudouridine1911/1915/1917 synthase